MKIKNIFQLILSPSKFIEADVEKIRKLHEEQGHNVASPEKYRLDITEWVKVKNRGIWVSFIVVSGLILTGILAAVIVNPYTHISIVTLRVMRTCSLGIVAWAVLSRLGYDEETIGKISLLEEISPQLFRLFYCIGVFLTVFTLFLEPKPR